MDKFKTPKLYDAGGDVSQRWYVEFFYRDPDSGKWIRFKHYISCRITSPTARRNKALEIIRDLKTRLKQGYNPWSREELRHTDILSAIDKITEIKKDTLRKRSFQSFRSHMKIFKEWLREQGLGGVSVDNFTIHQAQAFLDNLKSKRKASNRTHNNYLLDLKGFFNLLVKREWITSSPFANIDYLDEEETTITAFNAEEMAIIRDYLPAFDANLYVIACLIFYCFIRPQEIMGLRVEYLNLQAGVILIPGNISKNKKSEMVTIPDELRAILKTMDLDYPGRYYLFSTKFCRGTDFYYPTRVAERWAEFCRLTGITKNIYSLKHTGAGMAIERGVNTRDLQLQLRHSSLEQTQIYLDRFRRRPSEEIRQKLTGLSARSASKNQPCHYTPPAQSDIQGLSSLDKWKLN